MRGNTFYGKRQMFRSEFMEWFENLRLPPYHLEKVDGQYELTFEGTWPEVMLWEIPALSIIMELRSRAVLRGWASLSCKFVCPRDDQIVGKDRTLREGTDCALQILARGGGILSCGKIGA